FGVPQSPLQSAHCLNAAARPPTLRRSRPCRNPLDHVRRDAAESQQVPVAESGRRVVRERHQERIVLAFPGRAGELPLWTEFRFQETALPTFRREPRLLQAITTYRMAATRPAHGVRSIPQPRQEP